MATSKGLLGSATTKEELRKGINQYFYSEYYVITDDNEVYNTKTGKTLTGYRVIFKRNRWRFEIT